MRLASTLALVATLASPAVAQTQYADSAGGYVSLRSLSFNGAQLNDIDGVVGYRVSTRADVGLRYRYTNSFGGSYHKAGPIAGLTQPLGAGFAGRVEASLQFETGGGVGGNYVGTDDVYVGPFEYRVRNLYQDVSATVSRRVPLIGSVALRPTFGGYAVARQRITFEYPTFPFEPPRASLSGGVQVEIPLTFRLFGQDAAIVTGGRLPLAGSLYLGDEAYIGGGLRLNF